jgi:hypothetical protein
MALVVQRIRIIYTKVHRGMPGSQKRVELPRAFALRPAFGEYVFQGHSFNERPDALDFCHHAEPCREAASSASRIREGHLSVVIRPHEIELKIQRTGGAPLRRTPREPLKLSLGAWGRLITNGRFSGYVGQCYEEDTYNVAFVQRLEEDLFLRTEPITLSDDRANLF